MPINEATVSTYWSTYTGAIDAVLSKGIVVLSYWDSAKSNKPPDMNAFWSMWKTVTDKYGNNENAYFEIFNEPNMYSKSDLITLYSDWLSRNSTVPKSRVILDGTGNAQNVPDVGSASSLNGCLLAVHDYSFFGSDTWTTESQWVSQFKGEVGNYADRTVCTEWGGPMSPGSKNGVSYGTLDYSKSPTNYFEAYVRGVSSQLRAWNMGSFYWPGLRDGDWYSMTTKSGSGANTTLTVSNQSGLQQLQNAWTGPLAGTGGAGVGGAGTGGSGVGGKTSSGGSNAATGGSAAAGGGRSSSVDSRGGSLGIGGAVGGSNPGTGGAATGGRLATGGTTTNTVAAAGGTTNGTTLSSSAGALSAGGALATGGAASRTGGAPATNDTVSTGGSNSDSATTGGARDTAATDLSSVSKPDSSGCACSVVGTSRGNLVRFSFVLVALGVVALGRSRRRATIFTKYPSRTRNCSWMLGIRPETAEPGVR
ncbi:MAG TPA: cellulase family glycosylhydrolase [Polyangiaceae bacterium]